MLARFVVVGLCSNALLYFAYLALTAVGMGHKLAMTLTFLLGMFATFVINRSWTFNSTGPVASEGARFVLSYVLGFVVNWLALWVLVDVAGYRHEIVQAVLVLLVAALMFVLQRRWVFRKRSDPNRQDLPPTTP